MPYTEHKWLAHPVSIVVDFADERDCMERTFTLDGTYIDDDIIEKKGDHDFHIKLFMDHARLRKEELARLLDEYAQIVKEINRVESSVV